MGCIEKVLFSIIDMCEYDFLQCGINQYFIVLKSSLVADWANSRSKLSVASKKGQCQGI